MMNGWYHTNGWGLGAWIVMGLMMLAFWGLIAALVVYAIHALGHRPADQTGAPVAPVDPARRVLDERFARGDIDADEYNRRRDVLRSP
jgi:putative membrane protein